MMRKYTCTSINKKFFNDHNDGDNEDNDDDDSDDHNDDEREQPFGIANLSYKNQINGIV